MRRFGIFWAAAFALWAVLEADMPKTLIFGSAAAVLAIRPREISRHH